MRQWENIKKPSLGLLLHAVWTCTLACLPSSINQQPLQLFTAHIMHPESRNRTRNHTGSLIQSFWLCQWAWTLVFCQRWQYGHERGFQMQPFTFFYSCCRAITTMAELPQCAATLCCAIEATSDGEKRCCCSFFSPGAMGVKAKEDTTALIVKRWHPGPTFMFSIPQRIYCQKCWKYWKYIKLCHQTTTWSQETQGGFVKKFKKRLLIHLFRTCLYFQPNHIKIYDEVCMETSLLVQS